MNYNEAFRKKESLGYDKYKKGNVTMHVFVVPSRTDREEFKLYCDRIRGIFPYLDDKDALRYSKNGKFEVMGLSVHRADLLYDPIG